MPLTSKRTQIKQHLCSIGVVAQELKGKLRQFNRSNQKTQEILGNFSFKLLQARELLAEASRILEQDDE